LKATGKRYVVRDKVEFGVQLYKIKTEKIQGVNIETGDEIVDGSL
jgi:F0F1-type ATP synthase delta subunit